MGKQSEGIVRVYIMETNVCRSRFLRNEFGGGRGVSQLIVVRDKGRKGNVQFSKGKNSNSECNFGLSGHHWRSISEIKTCMLAIMFTNLKQHKDASHHNTALNNVQAPEQSYEKIVIALHFITTTSTITASC